jgi:hypothetical protein
VSQRILHIIDSLALSGNATQLRVTLESLADKFDSHVAVLRCQTRAVLDVDLPNVPIHRLGRRWACDPLALWQFQRLIRRLRPTVLHAWDSSSWRFADVVRLGSTAPALVAGRNEI